MGTLPELPAAATEDTPNKVEILGVWPAQGDDQIVPAMLVVGRAYKLKLRVSGLGDVLLPSEPLVASIESESFERVISFPRGNTCITPAEPESADDEGVCTIVFYAEGLVRDVGIMVRAQRALAVTKSIDLELRADLASARLRFMVPGVGTATWFPGDADPLPALQAMGLSLEEDQATPLVIELKDAYDNPLVGQRVELADWLEPQAPVQPEPDAGVVDDGGVSTDVLVSEAGAVDTLIVDASWMDSGYRDAAVDDAGDVGAITDTSSQDAPSRVLPDASLRSDVDALGDGRGLASGRLADGRVAVYRHDGTRCGIEVDNDARHEVLSDALGRATFCLKAGEILGAWQLVIKLDELIDPQTIAARSQDGFVLSGRTRAGEPERLVLLGHDDEGDEPLTRCEAGDVTPLEYFQVLSASGRPVAGALVQIRTEGGVRLQSFASPVSDDQGRVVVQVSCPITMPNRSVIFAELDGAAAGDVRKRAQLFVRLEVQQIERLRLMVDQPGQSALGIGRARALEPFYFRVLAEGTRGTPAVASRLNLSVVASQPNNQLMALVNGQCVPAAERNLHGQSLYTDSDGFVRFGLCATGLSTVLRPMSLLVSAHGQTARLTVPITLVAGDPVRVAADPPGRVSTMVGGAAGALDVVVLDEAGNGVPGAVVEVVRPPEVELTRTQGQTNAVGRFSTWISAVTRAGAFDLTLRARKGDWSAIAVKTVAAGVGGAERIRFVQNNLTLNPVLGASTVEVAVGESIARPLTLRLENRVGGGVTGEGIAASLVEGEPNACGRVGLEGRVTDDAGEVIFGGEGGVALEAGPTVTECIWQFSAGIEVQARLRLRQVAGAPFGGRPEVDEGTSLTALQQAPSDWHQEGITAGVQVRAQDRFGNPLAGLRMWLNATNCWIQQPLQRLDEHGRGTWRVAGGRDHNQPCTLHMRYAAGDWQGAQPLVIPIRGLPVPTIQWLDRFLGETAASHQCSYMLHGSSFSANGCYIASAHWPMQQDPEHREHMVLRVDDELVIRPDDLAAQQNAACYEPDRQDPYERCSRVQVLDVEEGQNGQRVYTPIGTTPIRWRVVRPDWNNNNALEFHVSLSQQLVGAGHHKALRIVQPDGQTVGPPIDFFAHPPIRWQHQVTRLISPDDPNEQGRVWGGHRLQLDDDDAQEAVFCGNDNRGGLLAVIDRAERTDPYPDTVTGIRLWQLDDAAKMPQASRADLACALGDLDEDGRKDLVIPLPTSAQNRVPRLMLLRGLPAAPFFDVENAVTILLNSAPSFPAHAPSQVVVSEQPNRIWVCLGWLDQHNEYQGACGQDGALSVFVQSSPFTGNPNQAFGAQERHETWPVNPVFQVADQVYFEGVGTVTSQGALIGQSKPWPEQPLSQSGAELRHSYFDENTRVVTTVNASGVVRRWDHHGALIAEFTAPHEAGNAQFTQDGRIAATVHDNAVYVWRTSDGAALFSVPGDLASWAPTSAEFPDPVLVAGDRVSTNNGLCNQNWAQSRLDLRVYQASGELLQAVEAAVPESEQSGCPGADYWHVAATAGAELIYAYRQERAVIQRLNGRTGERLTPMTLEDIQPALPSTVGRVFERLYFSHDRAVAYARIQRAWNEPRHTLKLALPGAQTLWEICAGNEGAGCSSLLNAGTLLVTRDERSVARAYNEGRGVTLYDSSTHTWQGQPYDPRLHVALAGQSSGGNYLFLTEWVYNFADARRNLHVYPRDPTVGGLVPVTYATAQRITQRAKRPHHPNFHFSAHLVPQQRDDGDLIILPRRLYRNGRTNPFYNDQSFGGQWGHADSISYHTIETFIAGDGEIIVARPSTWRPLCGNAQLDEGELSDEGQPWRGRWDCGASLQARCGDGALDPGEACDDGNDQAGDGCEGCLRVFAGLRQDEPVASCAALSDEAASGSYWVGQPGDARFTYCKRANGVWYELVARFANADGAQWRGAHWTSREHSFGDCSSLETGATARDCRSRGWDRVRGNELLIAEHLNLNDQVYEGLRVFRLTQPGTLSELAQAPANTDLLASTQLLEGGDNTLAFATVDDPPHLVVNYDLGDDGCHLATSTNSGQCTSGLACRLNNRNEYCFGDVNTDQRDTRNYGWFSRYGMTEQTVHLFIRPLED